MTAQKTTDWKQKNQETRNLAIRQLDAILATGLDFVIKIRTTIALRQDQYLTNETYGVEKHTPEEHPKDTVTTEYHDQLMADYASLIQESKEDVKSLKKRMKGVVTVKDNLLERLKEFQNDLTLVRQERKTWQSKWVIAENKNKELMTLLDDVTAPKPVTPTKPQIRSIDNRAIVKKVEIKPGDDPDPYAKVRSTQFYGDNVPTLPKGYPQMIKFNGSSCRRGKWIYVKHPKSDHLAKDEIPRLPIRSIRPRNALLTIEEVWQARRYLKSGRKNRWIEHRLGMTDAAVSQMRSGYTYKKYPKESKTVRKATTVHAGEGVITQKPPVEFKGSLFTD